MLASFSGRSAISLPADPHLTASLLERYLEDLHDLRRALVRESHRHLDTPAPPMLWSRKSGAGCRCPPGDWWRIEHFPFSSVIIYNFPFRKEMTMRVLLHICCANCAIYPVAMLREQNHAVSGFFFNHNIHPYLEFQRRLETVREYAEKSELPVLYREEYLLEEFLAATAPLPAMRCDYCYRSRLEMTARTAAENGFEGFSSSLLYSRYQQHEKIRRIRRTDWPGNTGCISFTRIFGQGGKRGLTHPRQWVCTGSNIAAASIRKKNAIYPRCRN